MANTWVKTLVAAQTDGPALTAAAAASCIPTSAVYLLPANLFSIGKKLRVTASGRISSAITTPGTARFDVRIGGTVVFDSLAILLDTVAAHTNAGWRLVIDLTCRAVGNGSQTTFSGAGTWTCEDILGVPATAPKGVLTAILPWNAAPGTGTGINNNQANALDLFFTQTVATGSLTVHQYSVEDLNSTGE